MIPVLVEVGRTRIIEDMIFLLLLLPLTISIRTYSRIHCKHSHFNRSVLWSFYYLSINLSLNEVIFFVPHFGRNSLFLQNNFSNLVWNTKRLFLDLYIHRHYLGISWLGFILCITAEMELNVNLSLSQRSLPSNICLQPRTTTPIDLFRGTIIGGIA